MFLMLLAISVAHRKIDHFNISDLLKAPPYRHELICSYSTGNSHGSLGVQFRKKHMKLKMFLMLLAISVAHQKIDHFNISNLLKVPPYRHELICSYSTGNSQSLIRTLEMKMVLIFIIETDWDPLEGLCKVCSILDEKKGFTGPLEKA